MASLERMKVPKELCDLLKTKYMDKIEIQFESSPYQVDFRMIFSVQIEGKDIQTISQIMDKIYPEVKP